MSELIPAILTNSLKEALDRLSFLEQKTNYVHIDIMDGAFVSNTTIRPKDLFKKTKNIFLEAHLMVIDARTFIEEAIHAEFKRIIFHIEPIVDPLPLIIDIKNNNLEVGLAINPETSIERILPYIEIVDIIQLMSVNPGKSGQEFIPATLEKIKNLKKIIQKNLLNTKIHVDGGVNLINVEKIIKAGANAIIANSAIFKNPKLSPIEAIKQFNKKINL